MEIPKDQLIEIELDGIAARLKPTVFRDGKTFCVLYGDNPQVGVYGCGNSIAEALSNWENNLQEAFCDDLEIKRILSHREPPEQVAAFLEAFREKAKHDDTSYNQNRNY